MASIINLPRGRKAIQFVAGDGKRPTITLGKVSLRQAEAFNVKVEQLVAATLGHPPDMETIQWVAKLDDRMHARLAAAKLVQPRGATTGTELAPFIDGYITGRTDAKPATIVALKRARRDLVDHFGASKDIRIITEGDADEFWRALLHRGLAINTARRISGMAKQFFRVAVRKKLIAVNPFTDLDSGVRGSNEDRKFTITLDMAQKVLDACPDAEWRLLFALSRFGGLRCPSEHLALKWGDVDWDAGKLLVHSPKTEHHEGKDTRLIPLFPELRKYLMEVFEQAPEGSEYVIHSYRDAKKNFRTRFERIIRRAGLEPWPKLFHNLRATRETELADTYPIHVVCEWIGNDELVAKKHYLRVTDEHFEKALHIPVQCTSAHVGADERSNEKKAENQRELLVCADSCSTAPNEPMGREGLEPPTSCV